MNILSLSINNRLQNRCIGVTWKRLTTLLVYSVIQHQIEGLSNPWAPAGKWGGALDLPENVVKCLVHYQTQSNAQ